MNEKGQKGSRKTVRKNKYWRKIIRIKCMEKLIDYMLLGDMGYWDMQRALRIGQEENFKVCFTYSVGQPIRNSCLVKVQMLQVRGTVRGGRGCENKKVSMCCYSRRIREPHQWFSEWKTNCHNSEKRFDMHSICSLLSL